MIKYIPSDIIMCELGGWGYGVSLLPLYECLARHALELCPGNLEALLDTSGCNETEFDPLTTERDVQRTVARCFALPYSGHRDRLLRRVGVRGPRDWHKPIRLPGWNRGAGFAHDVRGRRTRQQLNECHADARWGHSAALRMGDNGLWGYDIGYGARNDSSTWYVHLYQHRRESLVHFLGRIASFVEETFEPEEANDPYGYWRARQEDSDHAARELAGRCFYVSRGWPLSECTDAIRLFAEGRRIKLTPARLRTMRRWCAQDPRSEG
jgi:hypothetical protein